MNSMVRPLQSLFVAFSLVVMVFTDDHSDLRNGQHDIENSKSIRHKYGLDAFQVGQHVKRILETQPSKSSSSSSKPRKSTSSATSLKDLTHSTVSLPFR